MALNFDDLIPTPTALKEKKPKSEESSLSYSDLIKRKMAPSARAMSFEDLVPKEMRVAFPKVDPTMLAAAKEASRRVKAGEVVPEKTIPSVTIGHLKARKPRVADVSDTAIDEQIKALALRRNLLRARPIEEPKLDITTAPDTIAEAIAVQPKKRYPAPTEYLRTKEVPEVLAEIEKRKPIGAIESLRREGVGAITKRLPFVGSSLEAMRNIEIGKAAKRLQADRYVQMYAQPKEKWTMQMRINPHPAHLRREDEKLVTGYFDRLAEESRRDKTFWAKVGSGVMDLAPWMIEFAVTGGLSKLPSAGTQKFGTKLLGEYAKTKAGQLALRGAGWGVGAATRTTVGLPGRVAEQYTRRRLPEQLTISEQGQVSFQWPKEKPFTSFAKSWGSVFIEAASEEAGTAISGRLFGEIRSLPFGNKFLTGLRRAWTKLSPDNSMMRFWQKVFRKGGYSNLIGEIGEERLATIMHSIAGTESFGVKATGKPLVDIPNRLVAGFEQDIKNFPVEATVLSIPGVTRFALGRTMPPPTVPITEPVKPTEPRTKPEAVEVDKAEPRYQQAKQEFELMVSRASAEEIEQAKTGYGIGAMRFARQYIDPKENQELYDKIYNLYHDYFKKLEAEPVTQVEQIEKKIPEVEVETKPGSAKSIESIRKEGQQEPDVLIIKPSAKPRRVVISAKGKKKTVVSLDDKTEVFKFTDFGGGIGVKGKSLINVNVQKVLMDLPSSAAARKAATTLKEAGIDFKQPQEEIQRQFIEWLKENNVANTKEDIIDFLTGRGKELEAEDYIKQFDGVVLKGIDYNLEEAVDIIQSRLKDFASAVPEFALNPTFTFDKESGQLVFKDRYRFSIYPSHFGLNAESLKDGQTIRFDIDSFNIKQPSAKKLKTAEPFLGEPKILGRVPEKPIPIERMGEPKEPRKLTAEEESYERALRDIERGVEVEVEGGVTYKSVREDDIHRVAELGRKAGRQAWTVERDILGRQERGTAETKMDIGDAIKIIRDVFSAAEPSGQAKTEPAKMPEHQRTPKGLIVVESDIGEVHILEGALTGEYGKDLETIFYYGNFQSETPQPRLKRSLSVGDTVKYRDHTLMVMPQGWRDITGLSDDAIEAIQTSENAIGLAASWRAAEKRLQQEKEQEIEEPSEFIPPAKRKLSFEDLIPRPKDVKHIKNIVVDTFREWPQSIKRVGKDYWTDVMAVAKQLATPYRYKALRQTMLGVFRHKKRPAPEVVGIEVQDITDALTATHELGHNIDWLLNNKIFPSSIKARFPNATTGEFSLRNELKKISQALRPDMWERPKAYIKSHVELMADFISHYILDPEKTRELAPNITRAFEAKLSTKPDMFEIISRLQESRYTGEEPAVAKHIREEFPLPKEFTPLKLAVDMMDKDYVKAAEELGITAARHYRLLIARAETEARRIDKLVPNKDRQTDLVVVAENGSKNPFTDRTLQEILAEGLTANETKAINLFRAYQEKARQTVNKYLRGADIAEYIKFIEDYFIHAYQTPLTAKYKVAIARWAKRSPQAKKRVLPDLAKAVELGMKPRAKTLSEGLRLWNGINVRVMTNKAFLRILPNITNDDGVSILQKPQDYPYWPTVDYWPIRQTYAVPLPNRGILLFQGRVAVDPRVKPFIDAMFGRKVFNTPVRVIEGLNATWKAFELTLLSAFHHVEEFFSAVGSLGPRALPFVGGYYGKRAQVFGKKKLFGFLPEHIGVLKAGKELEKVPEFMEDYIAHGGQRGYISTEGINLMERMLRSVEDYLKNIIQTKPISGKAVWLPYVPAKGARATYSWMQHLLWDNVNRAKLVTYYKIVADGAKNSDLPIKEVKELAVEYVNDNFGGQEWLNSMFRNPKTRQFWTQLMMSLDWTWSQIKTARWPLGIGGGNTARRAFMRKIGRHHWFWYLAAMAGFTIAGSYAFTGKGPWENEKGHKLNVDWTKIWRSLPWNRDWKERGDYARRYMSLGKAGRELVRWVTSPLRAFGYKLSPVARSTFEQTTGYNVGSDWAEPWARDDLELYQEVYARFKHLMDNFKPFSLSGNNAFLSFPSKKGMTQWKAIRSFEELFDVRANIACGGLRAKLTKASHILDRNRKKLVEEIDQACVLNNVDTAEAMRAAWSNVKTKYYGRFWYSAKQQDADKCDRYADALLALGVTEEGFIQSLTIRGRQLSKEAVKIGIERFIERQKQKGTMVK